ncbi:autotransporter-associated beta strand repeat-containing protein [Aestuariivirga sp.]|uniref:autotransporter-associated beta strand repeat-containing protein n=1 Tax=Aestuariivirga sp. TaxID=2650926 RepID=UPI0035ADED97
MSAVTVGSTHGARHPTPSRPERSAPRRGVRGGLLASVAIAALLLVSPGMSLAQTVPPAAPCNQVAGTTVTCTGNVSAGVSITSPTAFTVLNVNSVTSDVTPAANQPGITMDKTSGETTVNVDLTAGGGVHTIAVTGIASHPDLAGIGVSGIDARSFRYFLGNFGGTVTVNSIADIQSQYGNGILAKGGNVSVTSRGEIQIGHSGSGLYAYGLDNVTVQNTGDITSGSTTVAGGDAIHAYARKKVSVTSTGTLFGGQGIYAVSFEYGGILDSANVTNHGNITATERDGIFAWGGGVDPTAVSSIGNITAQGDGIHAWNHDLVVTNTGNVSSATGDGIEAVGQYVTVISNKDSTANQVSGRTHGIFVNGGVSATITSWGDVSSSAGTGIWALLSDGNFEGPLNITSSDGTITGHGGGIYARTYTSEMNISNASDIVSDGGEGIYVKHFEAGFKDLMDVSVVNSGDIHSQSDGVFIRSGGNTTLENTGSITTVNGPAISAKALGYSEFPDLTITNTADLNAGGGLGEGIRAHARGTLTVDNTGQIIHAGASGIIALSDSSKVVLNNVADIDAHTWGIEAIAEGTVDITNSADVSAVLHAGIEARGSTVTLDQTGNVSSTNTQGIKVTAHGAAGTAESRITTGTAAQTDQILSGDTGIYARDTASGKVSITNFDDIHAGIGVSPIISSASAIFARTASGNIDIDTTGKLVSDTDTGIVALTNGTGEIRVGNDGEISTYRTGIVTSGESGHLTIDNTGAITSTKSAGIDAATAGGITLTNTGDISASSTGISAKNRATPTTPAQGVTITNYGAIESRTFYGVTVDSDSDALTTITNGNGNGTGQIAAFLDGIRAKVSGALTVTNRDAITSEHGFGIWASSRTDSSGLLTVTNSGLLTGANGIFAGNEGADRTLVVNTAAIDVRDTGIRGSSGNFGHGGIIVDNRSSVSARLGYGVISYGSGEATLLNTGTVTAGHNALDVRSRYGSTGAPGAVVTNSADLVAGWNGIDVFLTQTGDARVNSSGSILAGYAGINVSFDRTFGANGQIVINSADAIHSGTGVPYPGLEFLAATWHGISAVSDSDSPITIAATGNITSDTASGIYAHGRGAGNIVVTSGGAIQSRLAGITSFTNDGSVNVTSGAVESATDSAIAVGSLDKDLTVAARGLTVGATGHAGVQMGLTHSESYWKYDGTYWQYVTVNLVMDGRNNALTVSSTGNVKNAGGIEELAVLGGSQNDAVDNAGIVTGNVDLGAGANSFDNLLGGRFNMGSTVKIGVGNALTNAGTLSMGGDGTVMSTSLTGDLLLGGTSLLDYDLGAADVTGGPLNDLLTVSGNLVLDGGVKVKESPGGSFGIGVYRLIDYAGTLIDNGLSILGRLPHNFSGIIQTTVAGQVNLIVSDAPLDVGYWDGPNSTPGNVAGGRGGTSVWDATRTNWTTASGDANGEWDSDVGVFGGATGTVTVEGRQAFTGLQFVTDDYHLIAGAGGVLDLRDGGFIYVDHDLDTSIAVAIAGDGQLLKQGAGRLILSGTNSQHGTAIQAGTLGAAGNQSLGSGTTSIANGATLQAAAADVTLANAISVAGVSTVDSQGYGFTLTGKIGGDGKLRKTGTGTLVLGGDGCLIGGLELAAGGLTNTGALGVAGAAAMGNSTVLSNAAGAEMAMRDGLTGDSGMQTIDNAGLLAAVIDLGQGDDSYRLAASGTQLGAVSGGAGIDRLALNAGPTGRVVWEGDYVDFENLVLNGDAGASGRFALAGAAAPETRATLDLGTGGTARLAAGELNLALANSSLRAGRVSTEAGTRLTGNGTVYGDLAMAGTIAPGNDGMGQLTVDGDYEQTGTYDVEISHYASGTPGLAASDRIVTTGAVSFGGTVDVSIADGSSLGQIEAAVEGQGAIRWRILDGSTPIAPDKRTAQLVQPAGLAAALDYANGGQDVDLFLAWTAPSRLPDQAEMLWQLALQPDLALCDGTDATDNRQSCAFLQGSALSTDDDGNSGGDSAGWSGLAGAGGKALDTLWLGVATGYRAGNLDGGDYDRLSAYLWGIWQPGGAEVKGFAGLGHYAVDGRRGTTSGTTASWDYAAWQPFVAAEARYWMDLSQSVAVTPVGGLTSVWLASPSHDETGAGIENFKVEADSLWGMTMLLGGEARWQATEDVTLEASAGWQHLFGDDAVEITGTYAGIPGAELSQSSDAVDRDSAALGLGVLVPVSDSALLRLDYDATASGDQITQAGTARLTVSW